MEDSRKRTLQYLVCLSVSIASMTCGVSIYWTTPMLPKFHNNETGIDITEPKTIAPEKEKGLQELSWMASTSSLGIMSGSFISSLVADRFGRRPTLLGSACPVLIGTIMVVCATSPWMLYIMRFLWGCGAGILVTIGSIYLVEIADKDIRGTLTVGNRFMFNFGSFLIMVIGSFVSYSTLNYMLLALPIAYFAICWWIPETPYFLLKEGKVDEARDELGMLRGIKDEKVLEDELTSMQSDVKREMRHSGTFMELITGRHYRKAIIISVGLKLTQILAGSIPILQYLGRIIAESKIDMQVKTALIIFGAVRFVVGIFSSLLVDRIGRRPLLIYSYIGSAIFLTISGTYFYFQQVVGIENESVGLRYISFIGIVCANIISTLGFDSLVFVVPAEVFPINVKSIAMTSLNIMGGLASFGIIKGYHELKELSGLHGVFWFFAASSMVGGIFSYFIVPETKGKNLREIQIIIQGDHFDETCENLNKVVSDSSDRDMTIESNNDEVYDKNAELNSKVMELNDLKTEINNDTKLNDRAVEVNGKPAGKIAESNDTNDELNYKNYLSDIDHRDYHSEFKGLIPPPDKAFIVKR